MLLLQPMIRSNSKRTTVQQVKCEPQLHPNHNQQQMLKSSFKEPSENESKDFIENIIHTSDVPFATNDEK